MPAELTTATSTDVPEPIASGTLVTRLVGPPINSRDLHPRELEKLGDALLQRTTISAVIQMATALFLQWLTNFSAGQPRSKDSEIP